VLIGTILEKDDLLQAQVERNYRGTERLERALLQSVSHELKTPLSVVAQEYPLSLRWSLLMRKSGDVARIQQALRRLHRVIQQFANMTRIDRERFIPSWIGATSAKSSKPLR